MSFRTVVADKEDMDFFFKLSYETLKTLRKSFYEKLIEDNPGKSENELEKLNREEMEEYFDFNDSKSRVFVVKHEDGTRCGYLWMGLRNSEDPWDIQKPQWIYDIVVVPEFQGRGLGRMLMQAAEQFSIGLNLNLGLFVHSDNESALALYEKTGFKVKVVPVSKKLDHEIVDLESSSKYLIRNMQNTYEVRRLELERFKRKVLFSVDAKDEKIKNMYDEFYDKSATDSEDHLRLEAVIKGEKLVGSIRAGVSGFDEKIAQIYNISIVSKKFDDELWKTLIYSVESWAKESGYSTLYILLHSEDDVDTEMFKSLDYRVPGFFMEKRLTQ